MALGIKRFFKGLRLNPVASTSIDSKGEMEALATGGKLNYHNGTTASPMVTEAHSATLTNKSIDADTNTITNIDNNEIKASAAIDATKIANGSVSNTEFQYLDGLTSVIQGQIDPLVPAFVGDSGAGGVIGRVPAPAAGDAAANKFLNADGTWKTTPATGATSVGTIDSQSKSANGAVITGTSLVMQNADATHPGLISDGVQTIAGAKTFTGTISASNISGTNSGDVSLTAVGASPNANAASLSGQVLTIQPADGTNPGVVTSGAQVLAGVKTFNSAPILNSLTASLPLKLDASKNIVSSAINLASGTEVTGITSVANGGTGANTLAANGVIYGNGTSAVGVTAVGTAGNVLTSNGVGVAPTFQTVTTTVPTSSNDIKNIGLSASVGSNLLTVNLKQADGTTNPSTGTSAVLIGFRSATVSSGAYVQRSVTSALSINTVATGAGFGTMNGKDQWIYVYAVDNAGTVELGLSGQRVADDSVLVTTITMSSSSSIPNTIYTTTGRTNVAVRLIGRITQNQTTAGTYVNAPTQIAVMPLNVENAPGAYFQYFQGNGAGSTNTNFRRFTTQVQAIGGDISYTSSSTLGDSWTINSPGVYSMSYCDATDSGSFDIAITLNDTQGSTSIGSTSSNSVLMVAQGSFLVSTSTSPCVSVTWPLTQGDVITAKISGSVTSTNYRTRFTICKVANR